ncbi:DUF2827 family protein [Burkholderia ubonensis]|uniref:DUF2827 family protein n=1 Tax=Burkholderia ubonensis TaxID=101571 RepID=UPI0009B3139E|nr:DUF2827 family protein [Burkholderia ubonensis]
MRIGISVLTHAGQSVWENGLGQNILFLTQLLRELPFVTDILILNCGDQATLPAEAERILPGVKLVRPVDATELVDVVIEMGGALDADWLDYLRARGKKVVFLCCGQPYVGLVEPSIFKKNGSFPRAERCDEIWVLPKDRLFIPLMRTLHRCPVSEVPFLWDPILIERRAADVEKAGFRFGYEPGKGRQTPRALRLGIFEPNISVVKCCVIPMLSCDAAFQSKPETVKSLHVLNSVHMKEHPTFSFLLTSLELHKNDMIHLDHRHDFVGYVSQNIDAVVTHQWQNGQNYLHLDALYGGYPLIHNAPWLADVGYYYANSNVSEASRQIVKAASRHDTDHEAYVRSARSFLARLRPDAVDNCSRYARRLLALTSGQARRRGAC